VRDDGRLEDDGDRGLARDPMCGADRAWVSSVRARVQAPDGAPLAGAKLQLCVWTEPGAGDDRVLCLQPSDSDASGDVTVEVAEQARCMARVFARVLLPQSDRPALYCPIAVDAASDDASVTVADPYELVTATTDGAAIGADGFSAALLRGDDVPGCVRAHAPDLALAIAFTPETDVDATLSLPNDLGLAAGARAALWVQGGLGCTRGDGSFIEKGEWERVGDVVASADGARLAADTALPCVNWAGIGVD
jgi:hypothetical protein